MSLRINRKTSDRGRFWKNLQRLKDLLERGQLEEEEMQELVEILEQRLAWVEEDNRSYRTFFESLVSTLETNLQPPQIRDLIMDHLRRSKPAAVNAPEGTWLWTPAHVEALGELRDQLRRRSIEGPGHAG